MKIATKIQNVLGNQFKRLTDTICTTSLLWILDALILNVYRLHDKDYTTRISYVESFIVQSSEQTVNSKELTCSRNERDLLMTHASLLIRLPVSVLAFFKRSTPAKSTRFSFATVKSVWVRHLCTLLSM